MSDDDAGAPGDGLPEDPRDEPAGAGSPSGGPMGGLGDLFGNMPMFGDLAKMLSNQGPLNWDAAKQFATLSATGGEAEQNVDPKVRIAFDNLAPIAEMHVRDVTGFDTPTAQLELTTPGIWAQHTLEAYRPLFTELAVSLGRQQPGDSDAGDPMMAMMAGLSQMMAPSMMGMAIGSMVGRLAARAFGQYDLPIPRETRTLLILPATIDAFAADWSLPVDEMRLWVLAQEFIGHAVYSHATVRETISNLVRRHVGAFRPDPSSVAEKLSSLDMDDTSDPMQAMQSMQRALSDPEVLLGAVRSPEQIALAPVLDAATAAVVGYVDYMVDGVAARLIGGDALRIAEAVRRRRVEAGAEDVFIERLLGMHITAAQVQRGKSFVGGVVDRAGAGALGSLFTRADGLPTPAELDAPGLWLARLEF